jgi:hypothetical protein
MNPSDDSGDLTLIKSRTRGISTRIQGKAGQDISVSVLHASPMHNVKVVLLKQQLPACILAIQVPGFHDPQEWLVISHQFELCAKEVMTEHAHGPRKSK